MNEYEAFVEAEELEWKSAQETAGTEVVETRYRKYVAREKARKRAFQD